MTNIVIIHEEPAPTVIVNEEPAPTVVIATQGPAGPTGATGPPGSSGGNHRHVQGAPASTWHVVHGLGFKPGGITVVDSGGEVREGRVTYLSLNEFRIEFFSNGQPVAFSGEVFVS